ncbi:MAG TPA: protein kinase, partial [Blastocatellia bacterium]|nr:protein kinase [Blastocatellia bacterium]
HDRLVAIKILSGEAVAGLTADRFLREIRLLANLQHPNILPLHDSGVVSGSPYYVMPFVSGESLRDLLRRDGRLPIARAMRIAEESAAALGYAHRQGVVHRDVKPENILLSDGHVLLADFGIARAVSQSVDDSLTSTSVVIGTPLYMSPEQSMADKQIDERSDVYSLACVVFEMMTGQAPFAGGGQVAVIAARFLKPAPLASSLRTDVPRHVDSAIAAALDLSPDKRPPSADAFAAMLSGEASPPHRLGFFPRRWVMRSAAAAAAVIGVSLVLWSMSVSAARSHQASAETGTAADAGQPSVPARHTPEGAPHDLYLQGQDSLDKISATALLHAEELFRGAIARDSLYAQPWAGLAEAHSSFAIGNIASVQPRPEFEQARIAAVRALALDSTVAEAHAALAVVQMMYDFDWRAAERSLDLAHRYDPGFETTYLYRSFLLAWLGRLDDATASSREALHMNPTSIRFRQDLGRGLFLSRRYGESEELLRGAVGIDSTNGRLRMVLGTVLLGDGKTEAAMSELERAQKLLPGATRVAAYRAGAYERAGRSGDARALVDSLVKLSDRTFVPAQDLAITWAGLRDTDQTLTWLERAYDDRTIRPYIRDPIFDFVRDTPRYRALLRKMGLTP